MNLDIEVCIICINQQTWSDAVLYSFPTEKQRRDVWATLCGCTEFFEYCYKQDNTLDYSLFKICKKHFEDRMFVTYGTTKNLGRLAYPTLHLDFNGFPKDILTTIMERHKSLQKENRRQKSVPIWCTVLLKKCLKKHTCKTCQEYADKVKGDKQMLKDYLNSLYGITSENLDNNLCYHVSELDNIFDREFPRISVQKGVKRKYLTLLKSKPFLSPCPQFPYDYLLKNYLAIKIKDTLANI